LRWGRGLGAGFGGVGAFSGSIDGRYDVEIRGAIGDRSVGEAGGRRRREQGIGAAGGSGALYVITRGVCAGGPSEEDLCISGGG